MNNPKIKPVISPVSMSSLNSLSKQSGMTMISMVVIIVFLLFQAVIAMNVIPVYLTDNSVNGIMEALPTDPKARDANKTELKTLIYKRLSMNNIYSIDTDRITIKKGRGEHIVTIEYEPRGKLIGNLEYIVSFKHEARVPFR